MNESRGKVEDLAAKLVDVLEALETIEPIGQEVRFLDPLDMPWWNVMMTLAWIGTRESRLPLLFSPSFLATISFTSPEGEVSGISLTISDVAPSSSEPLDPRLRAIWSAYSELRTALVAGRLQAQASTFPDGKRRLIDSFEWETILVEHAPQQTPYDIYTFAPLRTTRVVDILLKRDDVMTVWPASYDGTAAKADQVQAPPAPRNRRPSPQMLTITRFIEENYTGQDPNMSADELVKRIQRWWESLPKNDRQDLVVPSSPTVGRYLRMRKSPSDRN